MIDRRRDLTSPRFADERLVVRNTEIGRPEVSRVSKSGCSNRTDDLSEHRAEELQTEINALVGDDLLGVESLILTSTQSRFAEVDTLCQRAASMGGKRLRPVLLLLSAQVASSSSDSSQASRDLLAAAASVELVHAASLVHDDVMDAAVVRRHQETIAHREGSSTAILLGDFLFTRAYALAASCRSTYVARKIAAAATELCEGELRQQLSTTNWSLSSKEYVSILAQKTGALCRVSCLLGSWKGQPKVRRALVGYGKHLGLAFQIFDDWLDYWGDGRVGKTLGTDLAQLKPTLPLLRLLKVASSTERQRLQELLRLGAPTALGEVRVALEQSDASDYTLRAARRCVERAQWSIRDLPNSPAKDCLLRVAEYSAQRRK